MKSFLPFRDWNRLRKLAQANHCYRRLVFGFLFTCGCATYAHGQGDYWISCPFPSRNILSMTSDSHGHVFVGTSDSGLYRSTDRGESWINIKPDHLRYDAVAGGRNDFVYAEVLRSIDDGMSWSRLDLPSMTAQPIYPSITTTQDGHVYMGVFDSEDFRGGTICASTDDGEHWMSISGNLDSTLAFYVLHHSSGVLLTGCWDGRIYIDRIQEPNQWYFNGGLRRSLDSGFTWTHALELANLSISCLGEGPQGWVFAGALYGGGMYRSSDTGATWTEIDADLSSPFRRSIRSVCVNSTGEIFIGSLGGAFSSVDNGDHWIGLFAGLSDTTIYAMTLDSAGYLYVGTPSGVFRSSQSTTSASESLGLTNTFAMLQNYPNPFNPVTTITYSLPKGSHVRLKIYDVLGKGVASMADEFKQPGTWSAEFDGSKVPSGVYFYRLTTGGYTKVNKMVLAK